ncbi:MAG: hypothetical protein Q9179_001469 [Wetmoreana sp. 5 TL-2023]
MTEELITMPKAPKAAKCDYLYDNDMVFAGVSHGWLELHLKPDGQLVPVQYNEAVCPLKNYCATGHLNRFAQKFGSRVLKELVQGEIGDAKVKLDYKTVKMT